MLQKLKNRLDNESAELLSTMQLRLEVNESYILKQKKMIEKYKEKNEKLEKEALASREKNGFNEGERTWMNRSEVFAQLGGFIYVPSQGGAGFDYLGMDEIKNFTPEASQFQSILTCRTLTEEAKPGDVEAHSGYLRRSAARMVQRNQEMKRRQQEMTEEEADLDPDESARIYFLQAENKRLVKTMEAEKQALQKQIAENNDDKTRFLERIAKQLRASCMEMEQQLREKNMEQLEEQKKQMENMEKERLQMLEMEMQENMKKKMDELQRQREKEIQEREAQKKQMETEMEQLRKDYTTKMEKERTQMLQEMKQQKSLEMIEFLTSLEKKKKNETMQLVTTPSAAATEIENKIENKMDEKLEQKTEMSTQKSDSDQEWEKPEKQMSKESF